MLDFRANEFFSFYSCLMAVIDGRPVKFEGVLIFIYMEVVNKNKDFEVLLNNTYNILQLQANISKESLKTKYPLNGTTETKNCNDIIELMKSCEKPKLSFVKIFYCIGVFFIILIGQHIVRSLIKISRRSRQVAPIPVVE